MAGVVGRGVGSGQALLQCTNLGAGALQAIDRRLFVDVAGQVHGRGAVLLCQVGRGDHAGDALSIEHGHMMDVVARHQQQGVECGVVQAH
ncbi:hypothetical protein FQZ97_1265340 [compost metagenome]